MDKMRSRISDKRVLGLVKAFLKSGVIESKLKEIGHDAITKRGVRWTGPIA